MCTDHVLMLQEKRNVPPTTVNMDGLLMDVDVQSINDNLPMCEDK
jgi:hypothetical protein